MNSVVSIAVAAVALVWLVGRQFQKRSVREDAKPALMLVLGGVGLTQVVRYVSAHQPPAAAVELLVGSLVVAAALGAVRAYSMRLWREGGTLYQKGGAATLVLWLVSIGVHLGADALIGGTGAGAAGFAATGLLLYLAVSLCVQRLVVQARTLGLAGVPA